MTEQKTAQSAPTAHATSPAEWVHIDDLKPNPRNPRKHGQEVLRLAKTILRTTWGAPILAQRATRRIIGGHGRLEAAREILAGIEVDGELRGGHEHVFAHGAPGPGFVPVRWLDVSDAEADAMTLADNARGLQGEDDAVLIAQMAAQFGRESELMRDVGYSAEALDRMIATAGDAILAAGERSESSEDSDDESDRERDEEQAAEALDRAAELQAKWSTAQGQLWLIDSPSGRTHRILCGDCRDARDVARALDGSTINVAFTSPPYASQRKYDEESGFRPIHPDKFVEWFEPVQRSVREHLAGDGSWFVNIKAHVEDGARSLYVLDLVLAHARQWGWKLVDDFVWTHGGFPGKWPDRFKNAWEPVFHFATSGVKFRPEACAVASSDAWAYDPSKRLAMGDRGGGYTEGERRMLGEGNALPSNVLRVSAGSATGVRHSAAFPVALPEFFIKAFSDDGDVIFDPFLGSATTIVAAERTGRVGIGTELSPKYVAVCLERLAALGLKPRLSK